MDLTVSLTVMTDIARVIESARIVLLSVNSAKVTEFCITRTIYMYTTSQFHMYYPAEITSYTHIGSGHAATSPVGAVSESIRSIRDTLAARSLSLGEVCVFDEEARSRA